MAAEYLIVVNVAVAGNVLLLTGEGGPQLLPHSAVVQQQTAPEVVGSTSADGVVKQRSLATAEMN